MSAKRPLIIACSLFLLQCAGLFKGAGEILVSDQDEIKLGSQFNNTLRTNDTAKQEFPVFVARNQEQAAMEAYVQGVCRSVVAAIPAKEKPPYEFTFTLIDKDVENAFAVPGGFVYIYTGILKK